MAKLEEVVGELLYTAGRTQEAAAEGVAVIEGVQTPITIPIRAALDLGLGLPARQPRAWGRSWWPQ